MSRRLRLIFIRLRVPFHLRLDHEQRGGQDLRRWVAKTGDGEVRVLAGREPIGDGGRLAWHVSVSIAKNPGVLERAFRRPTDQEFQRACELVPAVPEWREEATDGLIRYAFEVDPKTPQRPEKGKVRAGR